MYQLTVPISMNTLNEATLPIYLDAVRRCGAKRVFLGGLGYIYDQNTRIHKEPQSLKAAIEFFRVAGLEVGIWLSSFRHCGISPLFPRSESHYVQIMGAMGDTKNDTNCPLDQDFRRDFLAALKKIAELSPDMIMFDDDYRLSGRPSQYYMGCFCPLHYEEFCKRVGEKIPREELETKIFTGGKNKYRDAYREMLTDTLLGFSKDARTVIDSVNPNIRLGFCLAYDHWDYHGTDPMKIAHALAGNTKPFFRVTGAPYWNNNIIEAIESTRMEFFWARESDAEVFAEGDTWPRPRYLSRSPSKPLELFDLAVAANGDGDGMLGYLFDYNHPFEYETGYVDRYIKNTPLRQKILEIFDGKKPVGLRIFNKLHKIDDWELSAELEPEVVKKMEQTGASPARFLFARNSIPTSYDECDFPVLVAGENAKYVSKDALKFGAVLDATAAKLLSERGIDTGILSLERFRENKEVLGEYFIKDDDKITYTITRPLYRELFRKITCSENANILSTYLPNQETAAYLYENPDGMRFLVLAIDLFSYVFTKDHVCYAEHYFRQTQLIEGIEWVGKTKLPVKCPKNPNLYILASKDPQGTMSVLMINSQIDDVIDPVIELDDEYSELQVLNCSGRLEGHYVYLSDIPPYGSAAINLKK